MMAGLVAVVVEAQVFHLEAAEAGIKAETLLV
jgi:hypothetical protein